MSGGRYGGTNKGRMVIVDPTDANRFVQLDSILPALITISDGHHHIHQQNAYEFTAYDADLDTAQTMQYLIVTPNSTKKCHLLIEIDTSGSATIQFYRDATHTNGAVQRVVNLDENAADDNTTEVYLSAGGGADGNLRVEAATGGGVGAFSKGGGVREGEERILEVNTKYLLKITSTADNNVVSVKLRWYEHTDE
jgi:hypothetical protein